MLAIVVTLGGYFAGLQWLISPPDPWQASARLQTTGANSAAARKRPQVKQAEVAVAAETVAPKSADVITAKAETPAAAAMTASEPEPPVQSAVAPGPPPQAAAAPRAEQKPAALARAELTRPEPRREAKSKPVHRKLAERSAGRKLQLMVLRTYEGPDGRRFSRLLSLSEARSAMAFQPEW